jgi:hypothetical protein
MRRPPDSGARIAPPHPPRLGRAQPNRVTTPPIAQRPRRRTRQHSPFEPFQPDNHHENRRSEHHDDPHHRSLLHRSRPVPTRGSTSIRHIEPVIGTSHQYHDRPDQSTANHRRTPPRVRVALAHPARHKRRNKRNKTAPSRRRTRATSTRTRRVPAQRSITRGTLQTDRGWSPPSCRPAPSVSARAKANEPRVVQEDAAAEIADAPRGSDSFPGHPRRTPVRVSATAIHVKPVTQVRHRAPHNSTQARRRTDHAPIQRARRRPAINRSTRRRRDTRGPTRQHNPATTHGQTTHPAARSASTSNNERRSEPANPATPPPQQRRAST